MAHDILVVEDENAIRGMLAFNLRRADFEVREAADSQAARKAIGQRLPDLAIIDWMLPDGSGLDLTRWIKRTPETRDVAIIMVTARSQEQDKIAGLSSGADDYVTKPFSSRELLARITAVLRRSQRGGEEVITRGCLTLNPQSHRVTSDHGALALGPTEFRLLRLFMERPERVFSRAQLLDRVWGPAVFVEERTVDVHIRRLRQAMEPHGAAGYIQTVRGAGYRFSLN
ncbi:MAG: phosphate regulon transcriptional regulator PhoB [Gammaproteobacteria bacterium]|nr:phosphate regulon transcriptional regulator PhoB [Gammaproteobacteria bacterium]MCY4166529.1 phosphate regulon transcriptional regulator PhoB [Gammaproteobacteria bacterium]MCY4254662.1 phosphate regulon transcriptional regulator PhoB [Gammaproteobacteria bacterium]MCY4340986.1 phosphate regulon transcriptional regulator PhoB [Gammaproteobacteria bacterium]